MREIWREFYKTRQSEYPNLAKIGELMMCFSSSSSSVERAFNLLTMLLKDQRLTTSHNTLNAILNIKINDKVFTESEKNEILLAAVKSFMETSEEDRITGEDQDFSEEDDSEDEWDKHVYENITQIKCGSDTNDEIESTDDLETDDRRNNEYDDNFGVHNNDVMMNASWNHFDSNEDESFNLLDYNN